MACLVRLPTNVALRGQTGFVTCHDPSNHLRTVPCAQRSLNDLFIEVGMIIKPQIPADWNMLGMRTCGCYISFTTPPLWYVLLI